MQRHAKEHGRKEAQNERQNRKRYDAPKRTHAKRIRRQYQHEESAKETRQQAPSRGPGLVQQTRGNENPRRSRRITRPPRTYLP